MFAQEHAKHRRLIRISICIFRQMKPCIRRVDGKEQRMVLSIVPDREDDFRIGRLIDLVDSAANDIFIQFLDDCPCHNSVKWHDHHLTSYYSIIWDESAYILNKQWISHI